MLLAQLSALSHGRPPPGNGLGSSWVVGVAVPGEELEWWWVSPTHIPGVVAAHLVPGGKHLEVQGLGAEPAISMHLSTLAICFSEKIDVLSNKTSVKE